MYRVRFTQLTYPNLNILHDSNILQSSTRLVFLDPNNALHVHSPTDRQ